MATMSNSGGVNLARAARCLLLLGPLFLSAAAGGYDETVNLAKDRYGRKMSATVDVIAHDELLSDLLARLSKEHDVPIRFDDNLKARGITVDWGITVSLKQTTLHEALVSILYRLGLTYVVNENGIVIRARSPQYPFRPPSPRQAVRQDVDAVAAVDRGRTVGRKPPASGNVVANDEPLRELMARLSKEYDIPIRFDDDALQKQGVSTDWAITVSWKAVPVSLALGRIVDRLGLVLNHENKGYVIRPAPPGLANRNAAGYGGAGRGRRFAQNAVLPQNAVLDVEALTKQYQRELRRFLRGELRLIRQVSHTTADEDARLLEDGQLAAKDAALKAAQAHIKLTGGHARQMYVQLPGPVAYPDPHDALRAALARAVQERLSGDKAALYTAETQRRVEAVKQAGVRAIAAELDKRLELTPAQREQLMASLANHWNTEWLPNDMNYSSFANYFPVIPDGVVTPCLNASQRSIWASLAKSGFPRLLGRFDNVVDDVNDDDEPAKGNPQERAR